MSEDGPDAVYVVRDRDDELIYHVCLTPFAASGAATDARLMVLSPLGAHEEWEDVTNLGDREMEKFKPGDTVKLKPGTVKLSPSDVTSHKTATIVRMLSDVEGGVFLDRHMGGFRCWNVLDLDPVPPPKEPA